MKSEHRHELAENDLAKLITRGLKKIEPYQNHILLGMLVITVLVVSGVMIMRSSSAGRTEGVAELLNSRTADDYLNVAEAYEDTVAGRWARLRAGEKFLDEGIRLSMSDRAQAIDRLEEAEECFDKLLQDPAVSSEQRVKALYGMAMTLETLGNDTEKSIAAYRALLDAPGSLRYHAIAEDRIEALETGRGQQFYAWFQAQNPSPADRPLPRDFPDPFNDMFDDEEETDGLPPPPPTTNRYTSDTVAPDPPPESPEGDRPALAAPQAGEEDNSAPAESDETTTDAPAEETGDAEESPQ